MEISHLKNCTLYALVVDVAEKTDLVPVDITKDAWNQVDFELVGAKEWDDGMTLNRERKTCRVWRKGRSVDDNSTAIIFKIC